ncbi:protein dispatched isoform X1 [Linepithema humile]|uniref:protein dispatched isoform X1 n=1 Tax=Linepithema humile TaxID=83485 RepID=UPI00351E791B
MEASWFSRVVAHHPYAILMIVFVFSSVCLIIPLTTQKLPDFSDPIAGFEARGTVLAQRITVWQNLIDSVKFNGQLTIDPLEYYQHLLHQQKLESDLHIKNKTVTSEEVFGKPYKKPKGKKSKMPQNDTSIKETSEKPKDMKKESHNSKSLNNIIIENKNQDHVNSDNFFCNLPGDVYARVIIGTSDLVDLEENDLWSTDGILAQCHIDDVLRSNAHFTSLCQRAREGNGQKCCRSWSPANYVALLSNRSSCLGVTENDLSSVKALLQKCADYYHNRQLSANCEENDNCQKHVPSECYAKNAVYHLLHFLLDVDFISSSKANLKKRQNSTLQSAMLFLPIAKSSATLNFYKELDSNDLKYGNFRVQGIEFGLKSILFDRLLVSDSSLLICGFVFVALCISAYTGSIILTITTIFAVLFSLGISYAVYSLVLRIKFFPFMNLLAVVVAVGIGADDAFIYCKVWESKKQQKLPGGLVRLVQETMRYAFPSMFVTSLTTAIAFFTSIISNVSAINCFSLFAGITVIANFFLMVTWLPACVIVSERYKLTALSPVNFITRKIIRPLRSFGDTVTAGFTAFLTGIVIRLRWFWLLSLGTLATIACVIVFHYPGLQLPDHKDFQLFHSSHLFEQYDMVYRRKFWFEQEKDGKDAEVLPLRFVFGLNPIDNGDYLDPANKGTLDWDETFDISDEESQVWLLKFCRNLRSQPFYRSTMGPLLPNCFIEPLHSWMQKRCQDPVDPTIDYTPCCETSKFPYKPSVLRQCAAEHSASLQRTPYLKDNIDWNALKEYKEYKEYNGFATVQFEKEPLPKQTSNDTLMVKSPPKIKLVIVEYDSTYVYSHSFANMDKFVRQVEDWMQNQLRSAPKGMQGGWFFSQFEFYELQRVLYEGTLKAVGVSLVLALIILALVTLNPLVSLYAILAIGSAIMVTIATLILLGWKLNILESIAVSTAIGLAVDFSLHYAVSYKECASEIRVDRVKTALQQMGGPTLMAAITSGAAGALMLPSHVLAYIQIGVFLLIVMAISWIYATLFLCSMLAVVGPSLHFAQYEYSKFKILSVCFSKYRDNSVVETGKDNNHVRKTYKARGMQSESTISTSSSVCQFHCSELETLAARPPSPSLPPSPVSTLLRK